MEDSAHLAEHESLAQVRSTELSRAAVALGLTSIWSMPYRDSGMRNTSDNDHPDALIQQPLAHTVDEVLGYIERLHPQVIVTHDPYGGYGHPDHIRCCEATTTAFFVARERAAQGAYGNWTGPQKLYYTAFPKQMMKLMVRAMTLIGRDLTRFGRNQDINLVEISEWETPVHARLYVGPYQEAKLRASMAHASQYGGGPSWAAAMPAPLRRWMMDYDRFTRAFPPPNGTVENDLFAGVG